MRFLAPVARYRSPVSYLLFIALLAACAPQPPAGDTIGVHDDMANWHVLYQRPGRVDEPLLDLRAVGDVMLGRGVAAAAEEPGFGDVFAEIGDLLAGDLLLGNLESPLTERRAEVRPGPYRLLAPPTAAPALAQAGFTALALANNHALDAGPAGLADSIAALKAAGIAPLGVGADPNAANAVHMLSTGAGRVALLAFNDVIDPADGGAGLAPIDARPGIWANPDFGSCSAECPPGRAWLASTALDAVRAVRADADLVVVILHWGVEYAPAPSPRQTAWAERLVAAGADLILGTHSHVIQPVTLLDAGGRRGVVAYSLGNLVFDGAADPTLNSGVVLRVLADRAGIARVLAAPINPTGGRPRPLALATPAAQAALASLGAAPEPPADPTAQAAPDGRAWRWRNTTAEAVELPAGWAAPARPDQLAIDLHGNGEPVWAALDAAGVVSIRAGPQLDAAMLWHNEDPAWRFTRIAAGDPNDDGRAEIVMLLWQADSGGVLHSQPYLLGWRSGRYRIIWGGSATDPPIQDLAVADLDADGQSELVVLEGGIRPGDPGSHVSVWHWHGWGFQREWRSAPGSWREIVLTHLDGEQAQVIVAQP
jgi:poly-gamma-glutamate capsule biosynthesis protein CapA/YwtB (metallophosphatase superfamily)